MCVGRGHTSAIDPYAHARSRCSALTSQTERTFNSNALFLCFTKIDLNKTKTNIKTVLVLATIAPRISKES